MTTDYVLENFWPFLLQCPPHVFANFSPDLCQEVSSAELQKQIASQFILCWKVSTPKLIGQNVLQVNGIGQAVVI